MNYYKEIRNKLIDNEVYERVKDYSKERNRLLTYYEVGKLLSEAGKHYGEGIIKEYSDRLTKEIGKGYSSRSLKYMRKFYLLKKGQPIAAQLTWSHYIELFVLKNTDEINYYIDKCINLKLSRNELRERIKNKEYERLPKEYKSKLINKENINIKDIIKEPIIIRNPSNKEIISEKVLQRIILENIENFLKELGNGFSFIGSEYKIKIGNRYNYIDLLLFNIEYNCYVVVELKITSLRKEHIGQIEVYMNCIDKTLRSINHDKTIGIIICKKNNMFVLEYSSDDRIVSKEYIIIP